MNESLTADGNLKTNKITNYTPLKHVERLQPLCRSATWVANRFENSSARRRYIAEQMRDNSVGADWPLGKVSD